MSIIVQPILATSCMACTIPFDNSTSYEKIKSYQNNTENYNKRYENFIVYAFEEKTISYNRVYFKNNKNNYMSKAVLKYRPMKISRKIYMR